MPWVYPGGRCLHFAIDARYLKTPDWPQARLRLAVSFGHNPFTPRAKYYRIRPPNVIGDFAFGLHVVATKGRRLTLYDEWFDARAAGECRDATLALPQANTILASVPDVAYLVSLHRFLRKASLSGRDAVHFGALEVVEPGSL